MPQVVPLRPLGEQIFQITLDETTFDFRVRFNSRQEVWYMDISLAGTLIVAGIALVQGVDLLAQYALGYGSLFMVDAAKLDTDATFEGLGSDTLMVFYSAEEIDAILAGT